jgi:hypothetical protein
MQGLSDKYFGLLFEGLFPLGCCDHSYTQQPVITVDYWKPTDIAVVLTVALHCIAAMDQKLVTNKCY